jgi:hypothetical protein
MLSSENKMFSFTTSIQYCTGSLTGHVIRLLLRKQKLNVLGRKKQNYFLTDDTMASVKKNNVKESSNISN